MSRHRYHGRSRKALVAAVVAALGVLSVGVVWARHGGSEGSAAFVLEPQDAATSSSAPSAAASPAPSPTSTATRTALSTATAATAGPKGATTTKKSSRVARSATPVRRTSSSSAPAGGASTKCTKPVFTTSDTNGGWSTNGYYVHNNVWNASEAGPETLYACSYKNWYTVTKQRNLASNPGSVKSYPNVHKDYDGERISSFSTITSSFAATSPHLGIYNVAYDIWLNGVASDGSTEVMVWTENYKQVPFGDTVARVTFGAVTYDVWKATDNSYIAFVPTKAMTSGSLDLLQMFRWLMSKGWLSSTSTMGQIGFGVEVVSTNNTNATFSVTNFSVTDR